MIKQLINYLESRIQNTGQYLKFIFLALLIQGGILFAQQKAGIPLFVGADGHLKYTPDQLGNRIPDFSYCGYQAGGKLIPDVPVRILVPVSDEDATRRIQAALDYIAGLAPDKNGFRGAVLLGKGTYLLTGRLKINASGIVLRGSGTGDNGTTLVAAGTDRATLISVTGNKEKKLLSNMKITDDYVPVNSIKIRVAMPDSLKKYDKIFIRRPSTKEWIEKLGMQKFGSEFNLLDVGWKPGQHDLVWDRTIMSINRDTITLDAPITTALDKVYGGGFIAKYQWPGRIKNIGIENLRLISEYNNDNPKDEEHCWMAITIENACDAWVRQVVFRHFAGSAVAVWETGKRITVEDCKSLDPISEIGGQRRYTFWITGQQVLVQRCYAEYGYHDFATGFCTTGPNTFIQCESRTPFSFSGAIDSWASGILFDNVYIDGNALSFKNLGSDAYGAGWASANSVLWLCKASRIDCYNPPTAQNWSFGAWAMFDGNGNWYNVQHAVKPYSLYYAQLSDRLGDSVLRHSYLLPVDTTVLPIRTVEDAARLTKVSDKGKIQLPEWIDNAMRRNPISLKADNVKTIDQIGIPPLPNQKKPAITSIKNGWLVHGNSVLTGGRQGVMIWSGNIRPDGIGNARPFIVRFVPGRTGNGYTDDLEEVTNQMINKNMVGIEVCPPLWYDRRRDSHEWNRQMDGDAWPPFYELPFARTGLGLAWDGLSKYDLLKYNIFYWNRLKQFADLADQKGLILVHHNYLQHNILEASVHWCDFPWRPANNINNTGFPEPPSYTSGLDGVPDKHVFMAEQFYDTTNLVRYVIHKAYINQCLNNFDENSSVIQLICSEYTGPFNFVRFWLNTIKEWEQKTGKHPIIGLSVTKDIQDSILADPVLDAVVDLIDIRYWSYREDGSLYAQKGGQNITPRQYAALLEPGKRSFEQTWRAVREYRQKFPDKAVIYSGNGEDTYGWAVFMAGGSLASIPIIKDKSFLEDALHMQPLDLPSNPKGQWTLGNLNNGYIVYSNGSKPVMLDLSTDKEKYALFRIDPETGEIKKDKETISGGKIIRFESQEKKALIVWFKKI